MVLHEGHDAFLQLCEKWSNCTGHLIRLHQAASMTCKNNIDGRDVEQMLPEQHLQDLMQSACVQITVLADATVAKFATK